MFFLEMYISFTENKCICDLSVGHIDGELFRDIGVSWVVRKYKFDVLRRVSKEGDEPFIGKITDPVMLEFVL